MGRSLADCLAHYATSRNLCCTGHSLAGQRSHLRMIASAWRRRETSASPKRALSSGRRVLSVELSNDSQRFPTNRRAAVIKLVSADSLRKTGIFTDTAGDFRQFALQSWRLGSPETKSNARNAGISGLISRFSGDLAERRSAWLALQCRSHPSPRDFPAIREFNREFFNFEPFVDYFSAKTRGVAGTYRAIPYSK
jgi:hypothetical protein